MAIGWIGSLMHCQLVFLIFLLPAILLSKGGSSSHFLMRRLLQSSKILQFLLAVVVLNGPLYHKHLIAMLETA